MSKMSSEHRHILQSQRNQVASESEVPALKKVTLVVEYGDSEQVSATNALKSLSRFLDPERVELTLIHAEFDWLNLPAKPADEAHNVGESIARQEVDLRRETHRVQGALADFGFQVVRELELSTQTKKMSEMLEQLGATEAELLVIISQPDEAARAKASHFVKTLVTHAPIPVLLLRQPLGNNVEISAENPSPLSICLAVDSSEASMNAARQLRRILPDYVMALELATVQSPIYQENAILAPYVNQDVLDEALEANAKMVFEIVSDILENQGVPVLHRRKLVGSPATELGNLAALEHPDLIVVGSHNRKGVLAWLLGSVSSQLLHWDSHNLLVVR